MGIYSFNFKVISSAEQQNNSFLQEPVNGLSVSAKADYFDIEGHYFLHLWKTA